MKKISLALCVVMLTVLLAPCAFSESVPAPSVLFSDIENGIITVTVKLPPTEALTEAFFKLTYDSSAFSVYEAYNEKSADDDGNSVDLLPGMWEFSESFDNSGYAAAFVSDSGASKSTDFTFCTFKLKITDGYSDDTALKLYLEVLVTEDFDEENDIYDSVLIGEKRYEITDSSRFNTTAGSDGTLNITAYNFDEGYVNLPLAIGEKSISGISANAFDSHSPAFINVPEYGGFDFSFLPNDSMIITLKNSSAESYAKANSIKYFSRPTSVTADYKNGTLITDEKMISDCGELFGYSTSAAAFSSSYTAGALSFFGTGSTVILTAPLKTKAFSLVVLGDTNGDSVCDVLDILQTEQLISGNNTPTPLQISAANGEASDVFGADSYQYVVNKALS